MFTRCFELQANSITNSIGLEIMWSQNTVERLCSCWEILKNGGIGVCERNWGDIKDTKTGKRKGLIDGLTEKRAIIYTMS